MLASHPTFSHRYSLIPEKRKDNYRQQNNCTKAPSILMTQCALWCILGPVTNARLCTWLTAQSLPENFYLPGPSNSHSSPAILFSPDSDSKSSIARSLIAELAITTLRAETPSFNTSPGYKGKGSCARRISYMVEPFNDS